MPISLDNRAYRVVVNHEEQYSLVGPDDPLPPDAEEVHAGSEEECRAFLRSENLGRRGRPRKDPG